MIIIKRIIPVILLTILYIPYGYSQFTYPIDIHDGEEIGTCNGYFVDSGGDTLTVYQPGEDYSITFHSTDDEAPFIKFSFDFFELAPGDVLYVYDGQDTDAPLLFSAQNESLHQTEIWFSGEYAHFRFVSGTASEGGLGWHATISCYEFCEGLWLSANTTTDSFNYCPYDIDAPVSFIAEAGYYAENIDYDPEDFVFEWTFQDDTQTGNTAEYIYDESGAYSFSVSVNDTVNDCEAESINVIKVGTYPVFDDTHVSPDTICAKSQAILVGVANATTWTGFPTSVEGVFPIPDGTGESFESVLEFDVFDPDAILTAQEDFDKICINIEHVDYGQLQMMLECPNGNYVILTDYSAGGANLGEPVVFDDTTPGKGYDYCFSPLAAYGTMEETSPQFHEYTDNAGNYYFNTPYLPSGTYTPVESFEELIGCPLNGEWKLTVTDSSPGDNGFIFEWSLFFQEELYPDSLIFTPNIVQETWYDEETPIDANPVGISKEEEGEYEFVFEVQDEFGCVYDTIVYLEVLPLPSAEIISKLEIPVCEGDSTLLSLVPVDDIPYDWIYQWEYNMSVLEESVYDTLMAKETGLYGVWVTDTLTTCIDMFEMEVTDQNCDLEIPNVFTPNNDGINDYFEILNLEHYPGSHIVIYNRNGKKVFEHNDYYGNWWDGRGAPDGTYFYVLVYKRMGEERRIHGAVTVLR